MMVASIKTFQWIFNGMGDNNVNVEIQNPVKHLLKGLVENLTHIYSVSGFFNFSDGFYYVFNRDTSFEFPLGYRCNLNTILDSINKCLNITQNNFAYIFPIKDIEITNYYMEDVECVNRPIEFKEFQLLNTTYKTTLPKNKEAFFNLFGLLLMEGITVVMLFITSTCALFSNCKRLKSFFKNHTWNANHRVN